MTDAEIADVPGVGTASCERIRRQCVMQGIEAAIERKKQLMRKPRKLDGNGEAKLVMLACSEPPEGSGRWTLSLLCNELVELNVVDSISRETVRKTLKKPRQAVETQNLVHPKEAMRIFRIHNGRHPETVSPGIG